MKCVREDQLTSRWDSPESRARGLSHMLRSIEPFVSRGCNFLINFAYCGSKYSGIQRQTSRRGGDNTNTTDENYDETVQMGLEIGLMHLQPQPSFMFSVTASRTDAGVHALDNYLLVRLEHPHYPTCNYTPEQMEDTMNQYLFHRNHSISVKGVRSVWQGFQFRSSVVEWREYAYRFVIVDQESVNAGVGPGVPPFELDRLSIIRIRDRRKLDMRLVESALMCMRGEHSFRSFECMSGALIDGGWEMEKNPLKDIMHISLTPIDLCSGSVLDHLFKTPCFEIRIRSNSFLYHQVRRMVGAAIMVGTGVIDMSRLHFMLEYGHRWNWMSNYYTAPPDGLFLAQTKFRGVDPVL